MLLNSFVEKNKHKRDFISSTIKITFVLLISSTTATASKSIAAETSHLINLNSNELQQSNYEIPTKFEQLTTHNKHIDNVNDYGAQLIDAPKYYHLNELLYKSTSGRNSPQAAALPNYLRPLNGEATGAMMGPSIRGKGGEGGELPLEAAARGQERPLKPRNMRVDDEEVGSDNDSSSIDSLLSAMRRRNSLGGHSSGEMSTLNSAGARKQAGSSIGSVADNDEATIQRKSPLDYNDDGADLAESAGPSPSSRLRSKVDKTPRRKRRASARQAPPKLKSRRVSRNSRRRKLRHGIKPKRRA